jgi:hypothetical protein
MFSTLRKSLALGKVYINGEKEPLEKELIHSQDLIAKVP